MKTDESTDKRLFEGPMSDEETELLGDISGFVNWAIRNGLSFPQAIATIAHDVNRISQLGFSLEAIRREGFLPKVTGYSNVGEDDVGETPEPADEEL